MKRIQRISKLKKNSKRKKYVKMTSNDQSDSSDSDNSIDVDISESESELESSHGAEEIPKDENLKPNSQTSIQSQNKEENELKNNCSEHINSKKENNGKDIFGLSAKSSLNAENTPRKNEKSSKITDSYGDEEEEEEGTSEDTLVEKDSMKLIDITEMPPILPTQKFQYRAVSASLVRSINMYRETKKLPPLDEDRFLARAAFAHSRKMAAHVVTFAASNLSSSLGGHPYVCYDAFVSRFDSFDHAFTGLVNEWTTNKVIRESITQKINVAGVGVCFSSSGSVYCTLIVASRSLIGWSQFSGRELLSMAMAAATLPKLNCAREAHNVLPLKLDPLLCSIAFKLFRMDPAGLSQEFLGAKLEPCPQCAVAFGSVKAGSTPAEAVAEWLRQYGSTTAVLGDFNRVGVAFSVAGGEMRSIRILVRSLHAALIDGQDSLVDFDVLAKQLAESMNAFREQHMLAPLRLDADLFRVAQEHAEFVANGAEGLSPIEAAEYTESIEPRYLSVDISHATCVELSRAPRAIMKKWRNNTDCVSVLLNRVDDIGVGLCFTDDYVCHVTVIVASVGNDAPIVNKIVNL